MQYFYEASDPNVWENMPLKKLRAFIRMMPKLEAERMMKESKLAGWTMMKKHDRSKLENQWRSIINAGFSDGYDTQGRKILIGSDAVREHFRAHGIM